MSLIESERRSDGVSWWQQSDPKSTINRRKMDPKKQELLELLGKSRNCDDDQTDEDFVEGLVA